MTDTRCSWDGSWFYVTGRIRRLAVYKQDDSFVIGEPTGNGCEYILVESGFATAFAAIDQAEWLADQPAAIARAQA